jgi:hypothetical protein
MIFKVVEFLADSPVWLFLCGMGLTFVPALGIMIIHSTKDEKKIGH